MVVGQDDRRGIEPQGFLDHFPGMDRGAVDGTAEHLHPGQHPMAAVQEQTGEYLALVLYEFVLDCILCIFRGPDEGTSPEPVSAESTGFR
jgi:hypothetical protein